MIIMESAIAMNRDYVECNNSLAKIDLFANTAYREYEINIKESALKVIKEDGSEEDFNFLATEAAKDYIERAKKAIEKIVEAVKKFIGKCKENLLNMIENAKTKAAIEKVEDACKSNSKLRSTKVEYQDTDKQVGVIQQGIDTIRKKVSKVKAKGVATPDDTAEIDKIEHETMKKVAAISIATTVTLVTALAIFKRCSSRSEVESWLNVDDVSECDIQLDEESAKNAETAQFFTKASGLIAKLKKEKATKKTVKSTSVFAAIRTAISKLKGKSDSESLAEQKHESTLEDLEMFAYVVESTETEESTEEETTETEVEESVGTEEGLDLDQYFNEMCNELFTEAEEVDDEETTEELNEDVTEEPSEDTSDESTTEEETTETEVEEVETESTETEETPDATTVYMEQLERELFGDEEVATESTTAEETTETEVEETVVEESAEVEDVETSIASLLDEMENLL